MRGLNAIPIAGPRHDDQEMPTDLRKNRGQVVGQQRLELEIGEGENARERIERKVSQAG